MDVIIKHLLGLAFNHGIGVVETRSLTSHTPSFAVPKKKTIILNMNWYNERELPLVLAHEIAHIFKDTETATTTSTTHIKCEGAADAYAISLLVQYYYEYILESEITLLNIENFMTMFAVPSCERWKVVKVFEDRFK
ncbi:hypothetical protein R4Y45_07360 [Holzapfeliella sp. He02]|uniref:IrrE N-terminal-like domain-containing protein n=1 Tax=Holzapfeliella saturejae TaxID=3082953 RepID=A0ABU8SK50_9LACO